MTANVGRRAFLGGAGLLGLGGALGATAGAITEHVVDGPAHPDADGVRPAVAAARAKAVAAVPVPVSRVGASVTHQAGIAERPAAYLSLAAYDLAPAANAGATREDLRATLRAWTRGAAALMEGRPVYPDDTVAVGLAPAALTVTIGLGRSALGRAGLAERIPGPLAPIPAFTRDRLDPAQGDGDLVIQVCAEDPIVATAAARALTRLAAPTAGLRWVRRGFRRSAAAADAPDGTPRNLMGQLDGTDNPAAGTAQFDLAVWADPSSSPEWMRGGSYLVARRIQMLLDRWDLLSVPGQEKVIGRHKVSGAPLAVSASDATGGAVTVGGTATVGGAASQETAPPDFTATDRAGGLAIPANAHVRLSHPDFNNGVRMVRRGYSYDEGLDAAGQPDAGLIFLAFQSDPRSAFTPIQRKLDSSDALSTFIRHTASALFAVPPAAAAGGYVGQPLLES
ncbi:MAG: Dyp-type peroxidase [Frankia sp.]